MAEMQYQEAEQPIRAGYFDKNAFRQKEKLLLVLKTGVAGLWFHLDTETEEGRALLEQLTPGTELTIYRDMDNEHDQWAISVYAPGGQELGYITRYKNETVARLMDSGRKFHAFVDEPTPPPKDTVEWRRTQAPTEDYKVPLSIYMEEL